MPALATKPTDPSPNEPRPRHLPEGYISTGPGTWRSVGEITRVIVEHLAIRISIVQDHPAEGSLEVIDVLCTGGWRVSIATPDDREGSEQQ